MSYTPTALQGGIVAVWATLQGTGFEYPLGYSKVDNKVITREPDGGSAPPPGNPGEYAIFTLKETSRERLTGGDLISILLTIRVYGDQLLDYESVSEQIQDGFTLAALKAAYADSNVVNLRAGLNEVDLDSITVDGTDVGRLTSTFELVVQS